MEYMQATLASTDLDFIAQAAQYLEEPRLLQKISSAVGRPIEQGLAALPDSVRKSLVLVSQKALERALRMALTTFHPQRLRNLTAPANLSAARHLNRSGRWSHSIVNTLIGTGGGFFGAPALIVELPLTTTVIVRSIAGIAQNFGFDPLDPEVQLNCLFVLGSSKDYYTTRIAFNAVMRESLIWFASQGSRSVGEIVLKRAAPVWLQLLSMVAGRFEMVMAEKVFAQSLPVLGAMAGGAINLAFTEHFNEIATYHFGLKFLERQYGTAAVQEAYQASRSAQRS